jgi:hypothetical protein
MIDERHSYFTGNLCPGPAHYQFPAGPAPVLTGSLAGPSLRSVSRPLGTFGLTSKQELVASKVPGPGTYNITGQQKRTTPPKRPKPLPDSIISSVPSIPFRRGGAYQVVGNGLVSI